MDTTKQAENISKALDKALQNFANLLASDDLKLSVADFARLLQIRKEQGGAQPQTITVRWVDEWNTSLLTEE